MAAIAKPFGLITAVPLLFAGCLEDLPVVSRVEDLRVLAIRAEPPEVEPGATVRLDALVVDPFDRAVSYHWYACLAPAEGQGFFGGGGETATSGGEGTPLSTDPYGGSCRRRFEAGEPFAFDLGAANEAALAVPADLFATDAALKLAYGLPEDVEIPPELAAGFLGIAGVNLTVSLDVEVDGRTVEAFKRVNVSLPSPLPDNAPNENPAPPTLALVAPEGLEGLPTTGPAATPGRCLRDGATVALGETYHLVPVNLPTDFAKYVVLIPSTTGTTPFEFKTTEETLFFSFFSDRGSLEKPTSKTPGSPENTWAFEPSDGGSANLWVVVRDGRGGVSWCQETLDISKE
jgi:hypothetical protein